jgi:hypothetical protein
MPKTAFQLNMKKPPEDAVVKAHARCCPTNRLERLSTSSRFPEDRPSLAQLSFDWE